MGSETTTVASAPRLRVPPSGALLAGRTARIVAGLGVLLVVAGAIVATRATSGPAAVAPRTAPVTRGSVLQTVPISGAVNPAAQIRLNFKSSGRLAEVLVKVGDQVASGQALARLDTTDLEISLRQAQANLMSAQAKYDQTLAGATAEDVAIAQNNLASAQRTYEQTQRSTQDDLASAQQSYDNAKRSLDQTRQSTSNDVAAALQALTKTKTGYTSARSNFASLTDAIRSDLQTYKDQLATARSELLAASSSLPTTVFDQLNALASADLSLASAQINTSGPLMDALTAYTASVTKIVELANTFDSAIAQGTDTSRIAAQYQLAQADHSLTATRLAAALDTPAAQVSTAQTSVGAVQTWANSYFGLQDDARATARQNITTLQKTLTGEVQLAATIKTKITQASTNQSTIADAVNGAYVSAQQAYSSALTKADTSVQSAANAITSAQQSLAAAQDKASSSLTSQENAVRSAQLSLQKTSASPKSYEITQSLASLTLQQIAVDKAKIDLDNATLKAPSAGTVASIANQVGETVGTGASGFVVIALTQTLALHGTIGEADVAKLKLGQVATVVVDAIGSANRLTGKVTALDPVATIQQGVPVYGVDVTIDRPDPAVRPGMTGTATVVIQSKQGVLTVPNLAIRTSGGQRVVQVMRDGKVEEVPATFGISNDTVTEVVSGLAEGELIVLPQPRAAASRQGGAQFGGPGGAGGPPVIVNR